MRPGALERLHRYADGGQVDMSERYTPPMRPELSTAPRLSFDGIKPRLTMRPEKDLTITAGPRLRVGNTDTKFGIKIEKRFADGGFTGQASDNVLGDPKLDPRSRALAELNKRWADQSSFASAQRATMAITAPLRGGRRLTLPHLADPWASQYLSRTPYDTLLGYGRYPTPEARQELRGYADGGIIRRLTRGILDRVHTKTPSNPELYSQPPAYTRRSRVEDETRPPPPRGGVKSKLGDGDSWKPSDNDPTPPLWLADGGKVDDDGVSPWWLATGAAALRPRHVNKLARPFQRALAKPVLGVEAVSKHPLSATESDARFNFAREGAMHELADRPVSRLQGAWQGDNGMEFNPLYAQELPRTLGRMSNHPALRYAAQMGENLEQDATPVSRFVPHLWNSQSDSNAMMVHGIDAQRLRKLAEILGPDVVTAHRPGNKAMVFPLGDQKIPDIANDINSRMGFPPIRYGRSDIDLDRVLMTRKPADWASGTYESFGARPRSERYAELEAAALRRPALWGGDLRDAK